MRGCHANEDDIGLIAHFGGRCGDFGTPAERCRLCKGTIVNNDVFATLDEAFGHRVANRAEPNKSNDRSTLRHQLRPPTTVPSRHIHRSSFRWSVSVKVYNVHRLQGFDKQRKTVKRLVPCWKNCSMWRGPDTAPIRLAEVPQCPLLECGPGSNTRHVAEDMAPPGDQNAICPKLEIR